MLACFALPQQAAAQNSNSYTFAGITYTISDAVATEGGTASFEITTDPSTSFNLDTDVTYTAGTAGLDDLGSGRPTTFNSEGQSSYTIEVPIAEDDTVEGEETFTVQVNIIANLPSTAIQATGTIIDNDGATPPAVDISIDGASADEGDDIRFTVNLSAALLEPRTLNIGYTAGTGDTGAGLGDLGSDRPTTLTLPIGVTSVNLDVPTVDDNDDEENETFTVTLSLPDPPDDPMNTLTLTTATATINDDDDPAPPGDDAVIDLSVVADVSEAANRLNFRVDLTEKLSQAVTVAWAVTGGTTSPADFDRYASSGTATIETGEDVVRIRFIPEDDDLVEGPETLELTIFEDPNNPLPEGVTLGTTTAIGTLTDNDPPTGGDATVSIGSRTVAEDVAGGNATFTVTLSAAVDSDVVLDVAVTAGASNPVTLGTDLGTLPTSVTIVANTTEATITVPITNDAIVEGDETFTVTLSEGATELPDGVTIATNAATGTITGRQADVYGGFDFLGGNGKWLIGALAGHEVADLRIGKATYSASYTHLGLYGGVRLSDQLVFDGALTYGMATPEVAQGDVSASYDANRITARIALTGDFGLAYGLGTGSVKVEPQVGLLYSREALGAFTDSAGGVAGREVLELGRFSFGPRLTWDFDWGQVVGGARVQWDFLQLDDGVDGRLSGAADIGLRFGLAPGVTLGLHGDADGIGITDGFGSLGGRVQLDARF